MLLKRNLVRNFYIKITKEGKLISQSGKNRLKNAWKWLKITKISKKYFSHHISYHFHSPPNHFRKPPQIFFRFFSYIFPIFSYIFQIYAIPWKFFAEFFFLYILDFFGFFKLYINQIFFRDFFNNFIYFFKFSINLQKITPLNSSNLQISIKLQKITPLNSSNLQAI